MDLDAVGHNISLARKNLLLHRKLASDIIDELDEGSSFVAMFNEDIVAIDAILKLLEEI